MRKPRCSLWTTSLNLIQLSGKKIRYFMLCGWGLFAMIYRPWFVIMGSLMERQITFSTMDITVANQSSFELYCILITFSQHRTLLSTHSCGYCSDFVTLIMTDRFHIPFSLLSLYREDFPSFLNPVIWPFELFPVPWIFYYNVSTYYTVSTSVLHYPIDFQV